MNDITSVLAFDTKENGTRFSLYYKNGENLTGRDFGPVGIRQNLLNEMSQYLTEEEHKTLSEHFSDGISGEVHFTSSGDEQVLYYSPIPDTNWMITILIRKNLIHDQISGIQNETMNRSRIQILVTCVSLLAFFGILALKARGRSKALLEAERKIAVKDALTGVGNKYAYTRKEAQVNSDIQEGNVAPFAIIVCDLNGLKQINDTLGHAAGDDLIQKASRLLCDCYKHSPVFRIGGDEFVAFLQGQDYEHREELIAELNRQAEQNIRTGEPVLAAGMAEFEAEDQKMHDSFERADQRMYIRKKELKTMKGQK
jgi:diguanylate cyclase (GGDEF)-like protein